MASKGFVAFLVALQARVRGLLKDFAILMLDASRLLLEALCPYVYAAFSVAIAVSARLGVSC